MQLIILDNGWEIIMLRYQRDQNYHDNFPEEILSHGRQGYCQSVLFSVKRTC